MTRILAIAPVLPAHSYTQAEILAVVAPVLAPDLSRRPVIERMFTSSTVQRRHTALPIERYNDLGSFTETNAEWFRVAVELGVRAVESALDKAGVEAAEVDLLLFTSVTGVSAPSVDAAVALRLGMRSDLRRWPSFGLGCVAGAAGIARVHDYLESRPTAVAVLLAVELCSLTLQHHDNSLANFVASGLFGDGAAAVVMVGDAHPRASGPRVVATRSALLPDSSEVLGFVLGASGFEIVLTAQVSEILESALPAEFEAILGGRSLDGIAMVAHPGGPRILEAFAAASGLPRARFDRSWRSLAATGNMSSVSVLHVLAETLAEGHHDALVFAVGPGVATEFVLLEEAS
ncbi:MAG: type III polyketide synthase [Microbacteriaceae bacterium]